MTTNTSEFKTKLAEAEEKLMKMRKEVNEIRKQMPKEKLTDYTLFDKNGKEIKLSSLFGDKDDLIIVHNMGKGCSYCTLWGDGFTGFKSHLENRAGFAMVTPDKPEIMKEFSESRNWNFNVLSNNGGNFSKDMDMENEEGNPHPGISTFSKDSNGDIYRVSYTYFGPGDDFCSIWHMFDMLNEGHNKWQPKYSY